MAKKRKPGANKPARARGLAHSNHFSRSSRLRRLQDLERLRDLERLQDVEPIQNLEPLENLEDLEPLAALTSVRSVRGTSSARFKVNARDGLRLRSGPDQSFPAVRTLPRGTVVSVTKREGEWAQVDLEGDGAADGFVHGSFLVPAAPGPAGPLPADTETAAAGNDILDKVTSEKVKSIFPAGTKLANIRTHLPFVLDGLRAHGLVDKPMVLMALLDRLLG